MKKSLLLAALFLSFSSGASAEFPPADAAGFRSPGLGRPQAMEEGMMKELNLTEQQKADMKAALGAQRQKLELLRKEVENGQQQLMRAVEADTFNEEEIRRAAQQLNRAQEDYIVEQTRMRHTLRSKLSPEQRQQADRAVKSFRQRMIEQRQRRMQERGGAPGGVPAPGN